MINISFLSVWKRHPLISTGLQPGGPGKNEGNRFNGFTAQLKPVETGLRHVTTRTPG